MIEFGNFRFTSNSESSYVRLQAPLGSVGSSSIPRVEAKQPEYLSVTQFANSCMITPQAVRKMITENRLEAVKMGEQYMIPYQELTRYLSIK